MTDPDPEGAAEDTPAADASTSTSEAQRAADALKGQIAALRDQVRQARADLLNPAPKPKAERRSFKD